MQRYQHILVAVELIDDSDNALMKKVNDISSGDSSAKITLLHAVEHLNTFGAYYTVAAGVDVEELAITDAKKALTKFQSQLKVNAKNLIVKVGHAPQVILKTAEELGCDLIVIGSHGRHGLGLLLGSTANGVLHGAKCDVLAVRVHD